MKIVPSGYYGFLWLILYIWSLTATPQNRIAFLVTIQFEKVLILFAIFSLATSSNLRVRFSTSILIYLFLFFWMYVSFFLSPFRDYGAAIWWTENYWKQIVVLMLMFWSINNTDKINYVLKGYVVMHLFYQVHSWFDFFRGGSYVFQQGMKRIIGIWSSGGIGAANSYAVISLFTLPLCYYWFKTAENKREKRILFLGLIVCFASILFSGTRGALICAFVFLIISAHKPQKLILLMAILVPLTLFSVQFLPTDLQYRYFNFLLKDKIEIEDRFADIQEESMQARIDGLIHGWELAILKPIAGFGPGSSPIARGLILKKYIAEDGTFLQLHSLYGQILAEVGFVGGGLILFVIIIYFYQLKSTASFCTPKMLLLNFTLRNSMIIWLLYGFVGHTLYRYQWAFLIAMQSCFIKSISSQNSIYNGLECESQARIKDHSI